jgi:hypothetical protein
MEAVPDGLDSSQLTADTACSRFPALFRHSIQTI